MPALYNIPGSCKCDRAQIRKGVGVSTEREEALKILLVGMSEQTSNKRYISRTNAADKVSKARSRKPHVLP
jgi:hypothetical protein